MMTMALPLGKGKATFMQTPLHCGTLQAEYAPAYRTFPVFNNCRTQAVRRTSSVRGSTCCNTSLVNPRLVAKALSGMFSCCSRWLKMNDRRNPKGRKTPVHSDHASIL